MNLVECVDRNFDVEKNKVLSKLEGCIDNSKKGSLDAPIVDLIHAINAEPDFVTTSSCSGRCAVFCEAGTAKKKTGVWLMASHDPCTAEDVWDCLHTESLATSTGPVMFKFEPIILHIQCRSLFRAKDLLKAALDAGMRNSGIVLGRKFMVAIRTTLRLEVPLAYDGTLVVGEGYVAKLVEQSNGMFAMNLERIEKLTVALQQFFTDIRDQEAKAKRIQEEKEQKKLEGLKRQKAVQEQRQREREQAALAIAAQEEDSAPTSKNDG